MKDLQNQVESPRNGNSEEAWAAKGASDEAMTKEILKKLGYKPKSGYASMGIHAAIEKIQKELNKLEKKAPSIKAQAPEVLRLKQHTFDRLNGRWAPFFVVRCLPDVGWWRA